MVWVGKDSGDSDYEILEESEVKKEEESGVPLSAGLTMANQGLWKPGWNRY